VLSGAIMLAAALWWALVPDTRKLHEAS